MGLGAGKLEEVRSDTANVGRVRLNKAMLAMMRSLDNFFFFLIDVVESHWRVRNRAVMRSLK